MKRFMMFAFATAFVVLSSVAAQAQMYYGGGYGRGLGPSCGYYGCYVQHRYTYQGYRRYVPPMRSYTWYGGPPRAYLGGRGGGWGGEW